MPCTGRPGSRSQCWVDEYDKPILDALETPEVARANRDFLGGLYGVIKSSDANVRFTFVTGVSKFTKVSLLSDLNNLTDVTLDPVYSSICGYTEEDLDTVFAPELAGLDRERIRDWYNGYGWLGEEKVYNPFDVLLLLRRRKFAAHWFETGTPAVPGAGPCSSAAAPRCQRRVTTISTPSGPPRSPRRRRSRDELAIIGVCGLLAFGAGLAEDLTKLGRGDPRGGDLHDSALAPDVAYLRAVGRRKTQHRGADWGAFLPFERYDEGARLLLAKQAQGLLPATGRLSRPSSVPGRRFREWKRRTIYGTFPG